MSNTQTPQSVNFGTEKAPRNGEYIEVWRAGVSGSQYIYFDQAWGNGRGSWFTMQNRAISDKSIIRWRALSGSTQARLRMDTKYYETTLAA